MILSAAASYLGGLFVPKLRRRPMMIGASLACSVSSHNDGSQCERGRHFAYLTALLRGLLCDNRCLQQLTRLYFSNSLSRSYLHHRLLFQFWLDSSASNVPG